MTDAQLHKDILDYRRGTFVYHSLDGVVQEVAFDDWYKKDLFDRIEAALAERGGRLVVGREQYMVRDGKIVVGMVT